MFNKKFLIFSLILVFVFSFTVAYSFMTTDTLALSKEGSIGNEVIQIQTKLTELGYYTYDIDGVFGSRTKKAVMAFQRNNGLKEDGIVGTQTLAALGITRADSSGKFTEAEIALLARVISAEAKGESYEGQVAVGAVILNRVEHPSFPNTISGVVYQYRAFECVANGEINKAVAESSKQAALDCINGYDPSGGAIYYYNPKNTTNSFMLSRPVITIIGDHTFCS